MKKTAKEFLRQFIVVGYDVHEPTIIAAMKEFAIEVAKEALRNAHDACLKGSNGGPEAALRSILKQSNIPKL